MINLSPKLSGSPKVVYDENNQKTHKVDMNAVEFEADNFSVIIDGGDIAYIVSGFSDTYTEYLKTYVMT